MCSGNNELVVYNMGHNKALSQTFKLCDTNLSLLFNNSGFFFLVTKRFTVVARNLGNRNKQKEEN